MARRPVVVVVGLGPAGPDLISTAARDAIAHVGHRYLRTTRHPAAAAVPTAASFDETYERATSLDECYRAIVDELVDAASRHGEVLYAVPGSPMVAERTVEMLRHDERVEVEIVPAISFLDLAWARLRVDPIASGVRLVDGQRFAVEAAGERGPLLVAQCDTPLVLADIVAAIGAGEPPSLDDTGEVIAVQRLGLPDESIRSVPWRQLATAIEPDHLTSLYLPELAAPVAREVERFAELVATLRRECPWDREQTHQSLTRHLVEETYELLDAIEGVDVEAGSGYDHLEEELGDLLFQVLFHSTLAAEQGQFSLADVARTIHDKLYQRHPHVFGDVEVEGAHDVVRNWEQIKQAEKGRASIFEGIPSHLPGLLYALKVQKKAASLAERGVAVPDIPQVSAAAEAVSGPADAERVGDLLFAVVDLARRHGIDPESALRATATRHRDVVEGAEADRSETPGTPPGTAPMPR
jgi:tetrapyrrole methylase family protein / MazG family protein